jgi:hypothetical protein
MILDPNSLTQFLEANPVAVYLASMPLVLTFLLSILLKFTWPSDVKVVVTVFCCFLAAAGWLAVHTWSNHAFILYGMVLVGLTGLIYRILKPGLEALSIRTDLATGRIDETDPVVQQAPHKPVIKVRM